MPKYFWNIFNLNKIIYKCIVYEFIKINISKNEITLNDMGNLTINFTRKFPYI